MSFELKLVGENLEQEIERTKGWSTSWNEGRIEGMKYAIGLINIALGTEPKEDSHVDSEN